MAIYETRLGRIIEALGRYYSVVSKEKFMSILAFGGDDPIGDFGKVALDPTPEHHKLIRTFTDATEGGAIMVKNFEALKSLMDGLDENEVKDAKDLVQKLYRYVGEPESFKTVWDDFESVCSSLSVSDMCDLKPGSDGSKDGVINGAFASPTKFTPNLCAIEVFNPKLVPAARDSGAAGLFLNCLPTLELSRCQPHLDITLVSPGNGLNDDGRIQSIGIMQHVLGQSAPASDADKALASAVNEAAIAGVLEKHDSETAAAKAQGKNLPELPEVSSAGMEMFTSPQTMVPVIGTGKGATLETHNDYEAFQDIKGDDGKSLSVGGRRGASIIDPFRPLMSVEDFSISVSPSRGMMSHKTADLSLVVHDRSRLGEVGEFVKPDLYGKSELLITYGWSHPDDSADALQGAGGSLKLTGNFYGSFLNAMKVTEKYMIVNSSFSFDETGQVKVKLKLSMKGASNVDTNTIAQGEEIESATQGLKDMVAVIKEIKKKIITEAKAMGDDSAKDMFGESFFAAASSTSRAMTLDEDAQKALKKFITSNRGASGDVGKLAGTLEDMFGKDGKGGAVQKLRMTIGEAVGKKMSHMANLRVQNKDPFARDVTGHAGSTKFVNIPKNSMAHISYGALLMYMVGKPLAATRRFDEIQFIFYPLNEKASYLKDLTTAQIPINILEFGTTFIDNTKTDVNLPLGRFMKLVGKNFIHNQAAEAYGMASLYETDKDSGKKKIKESFKEKPGKLNDEKKQRLQDAYGPDGDLVFKMPRIRFHIEAVPAKLTGHDEGKRATILRIHVYDAVCTPHTALGKLMTAARSESLGLLTTKASKATKAAKKSDKSDDAENSVTHADAFYEQLKSALDFGLLEAVPGISGPISEFNPETQPNTYFRIKGGFPALKNFMQSSMPTIIYGSTTSAVLSADVSSMNDPKLASINMQRGGMGGGTTAQGVRDSGVPLQTAPVELSLTTYGCPVVNYGQSFFVDFGTGTTIDNVYVVSGIDHSIEKGKFETKLKMTQVDAFGKYTSMISSVTKALSALKDKKESGAT